MRIDKDVTCAKPVNTSPEELRMLADKLEAAHKNCLPGQKISFLAEGDLMFVYSPLVKSSAATGLLKSYKAFEGSSEERQEEPVLQN